MTILLILAAAAGGWYFGIQSAQDPEPTSTQPIESTTPDPKTKSVVRGLGKLEPQTGVLKIMAPVGQRIESLFDLKIGSTVAADQPIVKLSGSEKAELELQLALAKKADAEKKASVENVQGQLQREAAGLALQEAVAKRDEVASKSKGVDLLRAQLQMAKQLLQNLQDLKSNPDTQRLIGQTDIDKQQLIVQQLETKIIQSEDEIRLAQEQIKRAEKVAELDIERVDTLLNESGLPENSINAAIDAAKKAIEMLEIKSPIEGTVLDIVVRPGDTATNQPVMLVGDTSNMVCVAEINDSSLIDVQIGSTAKLTSSAMSAPLTGKVVSKGIMIGPPSMKDPNPFASVDRKTGRVVIALDDSQAAESFVNLQVDVTIESAEQTD